MKNNFNMKLVIRNLDLKKIKKIISSEAKLKLVNSYIKKRTSLRDIKNIDYVIDGLNVEGGSVNGFRNIEKLLETDMFGDKKILVISRDNLKPQSNHDNVTCERFAKKYSNIKIMYIHTSIMLPNRKRFQLIQSCKNNTYCTKSEQDKSKKSTRLCTTPVSELLNFRPVHDLCEVDDLLVLYYSLINPKSKIIAKTEEYHKNFNKENIYHIKLFMNIPITLYSGTLIKHCYLDPHKMLPKFIYAYNHDKITSSRNIKFEKLKIKK